MTLELQVQLDVYRSIAASGRVPLADEVAGRFELPLERLREIYGGIAARRLLVLEPDGLTIRMAPPFSGIPTQHRVVSGGVEYFANCAWDALAIPAALHREAEVRSRCEQSGEPLRLPVHLGGPPPSDWLFHCEVPAARWWQDIVYT